jgi:hypothetical protein
MEDSEIKVRIILTDAALAGVLDEIVSKTTQMLASNPEALYETLKARRADIGGMLELARRLNDHRLVRVLEAHADELRRQIEAL